MWQAVAAQPFNLDSRLEAPRSVDGSIGEFWLENPFDFERLQGFNLSMYERNRFFVNDGEHMLDASHISGIDINADTRAVAVGDLNEDGRPDLVVRSVGGGALRIFLNDIASGSSLKVTLRGSRSNAGGIGARLLLEMGGRRLYREHFPQNSLMSQNANETIFGLGDYDGPMKLTVSWPSGIVQVLENVQPGPLHLQEPEE